MGNKVYILYHGNCFDGFGAAYAAWQKFGDSATYLECHYGKPLPEVDDGSDVYMIDFSSDRETIEALAKRVNLVVLDHHKTAEEALKGLPYATFDMNRSGAMLAWNYFFPGFIVPTLIEYVQDRDLWTFKLKHSEEVHASLASHPKTFESWKAWENRDWFEIIREGEAILRYKDQQVDMILKNAYWTTMSGFDIICVNATSHWSDVGNQLCKRYPTAKFAASWYIDDQGNKKWSLRSVGDFDVSAIAKKFGGGGHKNAAGFVSGFVE